MSPIRMLGLVVLILGALALAYGGFTYTSDTHRAEVGPLSFSIAEKERVNVPLWAGLGAVIVGGLMLAAGGRRR